MNNIIPPGLGPVALPVTVVVPSAHLGVPSLAAFLDLMIGKIAVPAPKNPATDDKRQGDAATGNSLPEKKAEIDPALLWLFTTSPVLSPTTPALVPQPAEPAPGSVAETPDTITAPQPQPLDPLRQAGDAVSDPGILPGKPLPSQPLKPRDGTVLTGPIMAQPTPPLAPTAANTSSIPLPSVTSGPQAAMFVLALGDQGLADDDKPASSPMTTDASRLAATTAAAPIAQPGGAQNQGLDTGRPDWPQKMIDHIEALRDNADANDTSIRLKPEALGRVDIALRTHENGAISVRFTAEQPTTRTLIADAAPQLTAAAEARGIRLSGTSVDLGGQGDQRPRPDVERPQNISNHLAAPRGDDSQAVDDGRIA